MLSHEEKPFKSMDFSVAWMEKPMKNLMGCLLIIVVFYVFFSMIVPFKKLILMVLDGSSWGFPVLWTDVHWS